MWKIGLIGTGYWSDKHLQAWQRIPGVEVTALCDRDEAKRLAAANRIGLPVEQTYAELADMLAQADFDILDIVTGPETHLPFVRLAAAAGKHVMCQKPFAPTLAEAEEIVQVAQQAGIRLMVTENWRWLQPFQAIRQIMDQGQLGDIRMVRYTHTDYYTPRMALDKTLPQPFFREMPQLLFYEMGVHWLDTWRFLFGDPQRLYAAFMRISPHVVGEDTGMITLSGDGWHGHMDMSWATRRALEQELGDEVGPLHREQMSIEGTLATLKYGMDGSLTLVDDRGREQICVAHTELDHDESHFRLQSHFIDCLNTGRSFDTSGEDNLKTLQLVFAAYESAREHQVISF